MKYSQVGHFHPRFVRHFHPRLTRVGLESDIERLFVLTATRAGSLMRFCVRSPALHRGKRTAE
jgi:hypothetical protein